MSFTESPASKAAEVDALRVEWAPYPLIPDLINTDLDPSGNCTLSHLFVRFEY